MNSVGVIGWAWLRCVSEGETTVVDDTIMPHQCKRHLSLLHETAFVLPTSGGRTVLFEQRHVRHSANNACLTPESRLRLHIAEPDLQVGCKIFAHQFQHGYLGVSIQLDKNQSIEWFDLTIIIRFNSPLSSWPLAQVLWAPEEGPCLHTTNIQPCQRLL